MRDQRIRNELELLQHAVTATPERLSSLLLHPADRPTEARFILHGAPCLTFPPPSSTENWHEHIRTQQEVRVTFPRYFPAMPIEAFVAGPVFHPNAHPDTGFLCLWSTHRVAHNVLNSIARIAAVLSWQLVNREPEHTMQPQALSWFDSLPEKEQGRIPLPLAPMPFPCTTLPLAPAHFRRRLS